MEIWKSIIGYEGIYEISNYGRLKSLDRIISHKNGTVQHRKEKIRPTVLNTDGYCSSKLCKNGESITVRIHRLVANAFIPNPNNFLEVNHIDCDRTNNNVSNLEWCSHLQNIHYCLKMGNHFCQTDIFGKNNPNYGNTTLKEKYHNNPKLKMLNSRKNGSNGRAIKISLYSCDGVFLKSFNWIGECAKYLQDIGATKAQINSIRSNISNAANNNREYLSYYYKKND